MKAGTVGVPASSAESTREGSSWGRERPPMGVGLETTFRVYPPVSHSEGRSTGVPGLKGVGGAGKLPSAQGQEHSKCPTGGTKHGLLA